MSEILFARLDELNAAVANLQGQISAIAPIDNANIIALSLLDSSVGQVTQTALATFTKRVLTGTAAEITVTNGTGVSGNPTLSLPAALTFTGKTITGGSFVGIALGTPVSGIATNLTGTAAGLTAGNVTTNANLTGEVTSVGNAATMLNSAVIGKVLTGYVSGAGVVSATDTILAAIQKLNGNNATNANLTGVITSVGNATSIASQTGTGTKFVVDTSPTLVTPILGVATATSINAVGISSTSTGTIAVNASTLTANVSVTLGGTASSLTLQGTGTVVNRDTTDTLTNKTLASSTNVIGINTMTLGSDATGDIYYRNSSGLLTRLGIGSSTNVLTVTGGLPAWAAPGSGGTVTNIATGAGLSGGPLTTTGTLKVDPSFFKGNLFGLTLSTAGGSASFSIAAGTSIDSTGTDFMTQIAYTKGSGAWTVGSAGAGSLDTGTIAAGNLYHVYQIKRPDTGVVDYAVSLSASAPTTGGNIPAAYTLFRRIGSMRTLAGVVWAGFTQREDLFMLTVGIVNHTAQVLTTSRQLLNTSAPPNAAAIIRVYFLNSGSAGVTALLQPTNETDRAPGTFFSLIQETANQGQAGHFEIPVDSSSQFAGRASLAASAIYVESIGWKDTRGRSA